MSEQLLELLLTYGLPVLAPVIVASALGAPLPASLLLVGAGAFAGTGAFNLVALLLSAIASAVAGDLLGFWLGWRGGRAALERWGTRFKISADTVGRAESFFGRWGGLAVLLTRFLLTPFGPIINIIAGASNYPPRRFALYDLLGETIWVVVYVGLGYIFSANWDILAAFLGSATRFLALLVIVVVLAVLLVRTALQRHHDAAASVVEAPASGHQAD